jgi:hypothetical protein
MPSTAKTDDLIYASHAPEDLPAWCRDLLEPGLPLPAGVIHFERDYSPNHGLTVFLAIPAAFAIIMTVIDGMKGKLILKEWLALFPIFTLPLVLTLVFNARTIALRKKIADKKLRMGLFLAPDALLLRMRPELCAMIPRRHIAGFEKVIDTPGRANTPGTFLIRATYRVLEGGTTKERRIDFACADLQGQFQEHDLLLLRLNAWLGGRFTSASTSAPRKRRGPLTPDEIGKARRAAWEAEEKIRIEKEKAAEAARPKAKNIRPVFEQNGLPKSSWEKRTRETEYFFTITPGGGISSGETWPAKPYFDAGGSITFDEFLAGEYQNLAREQFGMEGLEEMLASVEFFRANPDLLKLL